ncbi:hypothetical protein CAY59_13980 [Vibrio campbellii]|uniref:restriction endonuclease subunit S n=1 Tax=Vibrio campbellii TaxID=680 RepID=UPI000A2FDB64|nr:restriction endonuclease subunit S [Vibrio campbellii]ARR45360.1 hypothetical protein CAY59_13980 [Vibrio campbellii]EIV8649825.1 restriction endonuclease subunit S [Vibrio parahaemolyticus]EIV8651708.1 restriction endonuclease subunit S [Vibrio parahaemolyticus]EIV8651757.1 restriction endonuclease subunit S [Vibrio parahaemolyticus]
MNQLQIPNGWLEYSLKDLADPLDKYSFKGGPFGSDLKSAHYTTAGVRVLQLQDIGEGVFLNKSDIYTSDEKADELLASNIYPGDILLAKMAPVARCCIVPDESPRYVMCSDGIRLAVNKQMFDRDYVFHSLNAPTFREKANALSTGTTRARIGLSDLKALTIYCPTLPEQQKIAEVLSTIDKKIDLIDQKIAETEKLKTGLMQKLFSEGVGVQDENGNWQPHAEFQDSPLGITIPSQWEVRQQQEVAIFYNGRAYKLSEWEESGTPVIRLQNLTGSGNKYYYSNLQLPEHQYANNGDLLFMWSATFGPKIWSGDKAIYHYHIWKVVVNECFLSQTFMFYNLSYMTEKMKKQTNGSTMLHFTKKGMEEQLMVLPPINEQNRIVEILEAVDKKLNLLEQQKAENQQLKKGLMQKLLTGEWRVPVEETEAA